MTQSCGQNFITQNPIEWTGTNQTHILSYKPKITREGKPAGYRAKVPDPNRPGKYITKRFKEGQKGQAQAWLKAEIALIDDAEALGRSYVPPKERKKYEKYQSMTFRQFAEEYLDNYRNLSTGDKVRESTMRAKRNNVDHLIDYFGDTPLLDITPKDVRACSDHLALYGPYARKRGMQSLRAIMRLAARPTDERPALINGNPCEGIPIPVTPDSQQAKIPVATSTELQTLYEAMPEYSRISIWLGAAFGLRISEVCALQVQDVDFKHRRLNVRHSLERGEGDRGMLHLAKTKNAASDSSLPIPDGFIPILQEHIERYTDANDPQAMLIRPQRGKIMSPGTLRKQFKKAREQAGRRDLHFHTLRATYDDLVSRRAENAKEYMQATRRRDETVGVKHYQRTNEERQRELMGITYAELAGTTKEEVPSSMTKDNGNEIERLQKENERLKKELSMLAGAVNKNGEINERA